MNELRGKIARITWEDCEPDVPEERANRILTLIREKIEKVENPYDAEGALSWTWHTAFRETKRAILKALEAE